MNPPSDRRGDGGERPDGAPMGPPPEKAGDDGGRPETGSVSDAQTQTEQAEETQAAFVPTRETWLLLGLWTLVLAGGLALAIRYEP